jgi:hypothetical protein
MCWQSLVERTVTAMGLTIAGGVYVFLFATAAIHVSVPMVSRAPSADGLTQAPNHLQLRGGWNRTIESSPTEWSSKVVANSSLIFSGATAVEPPEANHPALPTPADPPKVDDPVLISSPKSPDDTIVDWTTPEEAVALAKWDKFLETAAITDDFIPVGGDDGITPAQRYAGSVVEDATAWHVGFIGYAALTMVLVSVHSRAVQRKRAKVNNLPL